VILVAACGYADLSEICSANSFAIDAEYGYGTRPAEPGEWERGLPIKSQEMDDPLRRTLKQEFAKPPFFRAIPIASEQSTFMRDTNTEARNTVEEAIGS
jgi:hypothetical protein